MIPFSVFSRLYASASSFPTLEQFWDACSGSVPLDDAGRVLWLLRSIWDLHQIPTIKTAASICHTSVRQLCLSLGIPYNTAKNWMSETRDAPAWSLSLMFYASLSLAFENAQ